MVHCLIWGACALAVVAIVKHRRHAYFRYGYAGGCGPGHVWGDHPGADPFGPAPGPRWTARGWGMRGILRALFERLGTTPGQEKVIGAAVQSLRDTAQHVKDELRGSRKELADVFRRGPVDEASMADIFLRHDTVLSDARRKAVEAFGQIHEALTDEQREDLADILERGPGFPSRFTPPWSRRPGYRG